MNPENSEIIIYQTEDGNTRIDVRMENETVWLSQAQMVELFQTTKQNVSLHINNAFSEGELTPEATVKEYLTVQNERNRRVTRSVLHYNLDVIISVGYRVKSLRGTQFRRWATGVLSNHLIQGWTLDRARFERNAAELEAALALVRKAARSPELLAETGRGLVEIVSRYTQTFLLLQRYDEGLLTNPDGTTGGVTPSLDEVRHSIASLKADLMSRGDASDLFGREHADALAAILGNLDQSVFGEPIYPTIERKAAHLLYFIIKNHPLVDGNKRSGAFLFVDFLNRNNALIRDNQPVINDVGLAALALLVAESAPAQKETMVRLIENMLTGVR
jgi:prophage maintenance system killer protein